MVLAITPESSPDSDEMSRVSLNVPDAGSMVQSERSTLTLKRPPSTSLLITP